MVNSECEYLKELIIMEYPAWKIRTKFKMGVNELIPNNSSLNSKMVDYDLFYDIDIEKNIMFDILNKITINYKIPLDSTYDIKEFICEYMGICIPSFKLKWEEFKKDII